MKTGRRLGIALVLAFAFGASAAGDGVPQLDRARSGPCVEDPKEMRRTHMELLRHDRDATVRRGVRDRKESLAGCVDCHASTVDDRVTGSDSRFCQGCHSFAAVKLDCFDCHTNRAREGTRRTAAAGEGR